MDPRKPNLVAEGVAPQLWVRLYSLRYLLRAEKIRRPSSCLLQTSW